MTRIVGFYRGNDGKYWFDSIMQDGERQETKYRLGPEYITEENDIIVQMQNADRGLLAIEIHSRYLTYFDEEGNPIIYLNNATFSVTEPTEEEKIRVSELVSEDLNADFEDWDPAFLESIMNERIQELSETSADEAIDLIDKKNSGKSFSSVGEFYFATRENNIDALVEQLKAKTGNDREREIESWKNSLSDFAEMLFYPNKYMADTEKMLTEIQKFLKALDPEKPDDCLPVASDQEDRENLLYKTKKELLDEIREVRPEERSEYIKEMLGKQETRISNMNYRPVVLPADLSVEVEYQFKKNDPNAEKKSADVILHSPSADKYMIVELKQWTEEWIKKNERRHPLLQAAVYAVLLQRGEEDRTTWADITSSSNGSSKIPGEPWVLRHMQGKRVAPLAYLHNQLIENGVLWKEEKPQMIEDRCRKNWLYGMFYSRSYCNVTLNAIQDFFR